MRLFQRPKTGTSQRFRTTRLLIVGCGDVGLRTAALLKGRLRLFGTTRSEHKQPAITALKAQALLVDLSDPVSVLRAARLSSRIIMLAPPPNQGSGDPHSKGLLDALKKAKAQLARQRFAAKKLRIIYVSTTGVYGGVNGALINESAPLNPSTDRAKRRVCAETVWRNAARKNQVALNILRAPGIYALERLPLERLQARTPALIDADDVFTNHIHADDLARFCLRGALLPAAKLAHRVFNCVDASHLKMGEYFDAVADHFSLQRAPRLPRAELTLKVSPMMLSFMSESRKIIGTRLIDEYKMTLRYPAVADFLSTVDFSPPPTVANPIKTIAPHAKTAPP